jgi:NADH-quinone oxidoreductase subunit C
MSKKLVSLLQEKFTTAIVETTSQFGDETVVVDPAKWVEVHAFLRDDPACQMAMMVDLCGVDYPDREPRFEVVSHLLSISKKHRLRLKARIGDEDGEVVELPTLSGLWGVANWLEREIWDMFGVRFLGHPDLRRILMYEEFEGFPLRKDYDAHKAQPLVPYLQGNFEKLEPFGPNEGMPFGRQTFDRSQNN